MNRSRLSILALFAVITVTACGAFKEAMTAHLDVVARAGTRELTVDELATMVGRSEIPLRADAIRSLAQLWVNYQILGMAGAAGDSLHADADADNGMWSQLQQLRLRKYYEQISAGWGTVDSASLEKQYNDGAMLAAAHILLAKGPEGLSPAHNDSVRKEAEKIAATVTGATFASVAKARSEDPGSKDRGGDYGVFPRGQMVPEFDAGILSVPPGGISKVVETQFGYHIIRRHTWAEVRDQFAQAYVGLAKQQQESLYFDALDKAENVQVKASAPKMVKLIAEDVDAFRDNETVIATARSGDFRASRLALWLASFPPAQRLRQQIVQAPDSMIPIFVKNVVRNDIVGRRADSALAGSDTAERRTVREAFRGRVMETMGTLGVAPSQLADSAADPKARETLAAKRIDEYLQALLSNQAQFVEIAEPIVVVLRDRYETRIVPASIDRVVAAATKIRASADSAKAANTPSSAVPMPGTPQPQPPQAQPQQH